MAYKTALIVDDSKLARVTLRKKLQSYGVDVELAESGTQALEMIQQGHPEIVFMDHLMPEMDGFEATQAIRKMPGYENLPVIMCTGKEHEGYLQEAQAIGANQILSKPPVDEALAAILATDFAPVAVTPVTVEAEPEAEEVETMTAADLMEDFPELDDLPSEDIFSVGSESVTDDIEIDIGMTLEEDAPQVSSVEEATISYADDLETVAEVASSSESDPIAQALDEARLQTLCKGVVDAERASIIAEVLAQLPKPEAPELDMASIRKEVEGLIDQAFANHMPTLTAGIQQQLHGELEASLNERLSQMPTGVTVSDVNAVAEQRVAEAVVASTAETDAKLQNLETNLVHHMQTTKASVEGLVAEALEEVAQEDSASDIEVQVDRLFQQQAMLSQSLKAPKVLATVSLLSGIAALAGVAYLFFLS